MRRLALLAAVLFLLFACQASAEIVSVLTPEGMIYRSYFDGGDSVWDVKKHLSGHFRSSPHSIHLHYKGVELNDQLTVRQCGLGDGGFVHMRFGLYPHPK